MQCTTRPRITELNPHLLCVLCGGYYIDASAIIECLHSFCKSCIVRYLETHKYCPICDVLVHKTKPLQNIRPDKILQSIVYKLVPNLYEKEMRNRRKFYIHVQPQLRPENDELKGEITEFSNFFTLNDTMNLSLEYINYLGDQNYFFVASSSKRYFRCQASVTIKNLCKLFFAKYALASKHEVRFFFNGIQLPEHLKLLDIAYMSSWKRRGFIRLLYQILEKRKTVINVTEVKATHVLPSVVSSNRPSPAELPVENHCTVIANVTQASKIEQIQEMKTSITNVEVSDGSLEQVTSHANSKTESPIVTAATDIPENNVSHSSVNSTSDSALSDRITKDDNEPANIESTSSQPNELQITESSDQSNAKTNNCGTPDRKSEKTNAEVNESAVVEAESTSESRCCEESDVSRNKIDRIDTNGNIEKKKLSDSDSPVPAKMPRLANDTKTSGEANAKQIDLQKRPPVVRIKAITTVSTPSPVTYSYPSSKNKLAPKSVATTLPNKTVESTKEGVQAADNEVSIVKTFSRPWNSSTSSSAVTQSVVRPTISEVKESANKSFKFFKSRNPPRFLGNPASGIRPMYQIGPSPNIPAKTKPETVAKKTKRSVSVLKIDPKTLCPIVTTRTTGALPSTSVPGLPNEKSFPPVSSVSKLFRNSMQHAAITSYVSPSLTPSSGKLPTFSYSNMSRDPMLHSINPVLLSMYPNHFANAADPSVNGQTSLHFMKAMSNLCSPVAFHPSLGTLFNAHHKPLKYNKGSKTSAKVSPTPAVQRVLPSNHSTQIASNTEHSNSEKSLADVHEGLLNGHVKIKKKSENSFSINNLLPPDKAKHATHACDADGVNQICDQVSSEEHRAKEKDDELGKVGEKSPINESKVG